MRAVVYSPSGSRKGRQAQPPPHLENSHAPFVSHLTVFEFVARDKLGSP